MTFGTADAIKGIRLIIVTIDGMKVHLVVAVLTFVTFLHVKV